jgi:RNA polymerase sigma-70 factor (ECF subfamily)
MERDGPACALAELDAIRGLTGSHLWHAARAEALRQLDRRDDARLELERAIALTASAPERALLHCRLAVLDDM